VKSPPTAADFSATSKEFYEHFAHDESSKGSKGLTGGFCVNTKSQQRSQSVDVTDRSLMRTERAARELTWERKRFEEHGVVVHVSL